MMFNRLTSSASDQDPEGPGWICSSSWLLAGDLDLLRVTSAGLQAGLSGRCSSSCNHGSSEDSCDMTTPLKDAGAQTLDNSELPAEST